MVSFDEYRKYFKDKNLSEDQIRQIYRHEVQKFNNGVQEIVNNYNGVDMDVFIRRVGGIDKIEEMRRINDAADKLCVVDGRVVRKTERRDKDKENLEEWKKGFMEGFEEAYRRLNGK